MGEPCVVVGAGVAGLAAAIDLARRGFEVSVLERAAAPGGRMRGLAVDGRIVDGGPTVLTMRWVFEELFADASTRFEARVGLRPASILARHAWPDGARLDLFADPVRSQAAIGEVFGARDAAGYGRFVRDARAIFETLDASFLRAPRPSPVGLVRRLGPARLGELWRIRPFTPLWRALGDYFADPRLRQLFGRYATYVGSSPFRAPATLMLIAHVEQAGVWLVEGGLVSLAQALEALARELGVRFRYDAEVETVGCRGGRLAGVVLRGGETVEASRVLLATDAAALASGGFGESARRRARVRRPRQRSLSALTWALVAEVEGFPLVHHNVFFSRDYAGEFRTLFERGDVPQDATVYVCAQDRGAMDGAAPGGAERLLCLVNAPPDGDREPWSTERVAACEERVFEGLERYGLKLRRRTEASIRTTPRDWHRLFPATAGAIYGPATHGWRASFERPGPRTALPGLYLAGGSTHPGAGVPMAALSGRAAAAAIAEDCAST